MKKMTAKALNEAFSGESQAHMSYLMFADQAKAEGMPNIGRLFEAISYAERVHAINHAKALGLLNKTVENLDHAIGGEGFEVEEMYPAYDAVAKLQGEKQAEKSIHYAIEAEKIHYEMYQNAKKIASEGKDIENKKIYICPICGFTHMGDDVEDFCPVCGAPKAKFATY